MFKEDKEILKLNLDFLKDSFFMVIGIYSSYFIALLTSIIITRSVPKAIFGNYMLIISIFNIFSIFSIPGLRTNLFKSISQGFDGTYSKVIKYSVKFSLIGVLNLIIFSIVIIFFKFFENPIETGITLLLLSGFLPLIYSLDYWQFLLKGKQKFKILSILTTFKSILTLILLSIFIIFLNFYALFLLVLLNLASKAVINIFLSIYSKKFIDNNHYESTWKKQGFAFSIMDISSLVLYSMDLFILGFFLSYQELAIYSVVIVIVNGILIGVKGVIEIFFPRIYKHKKDLSIKTILIIFFLSFIIPTLLGLGIDSLIILMYTENYFDAIIYIKFYLYLIPFIIFSLFMVSYLIKHNCNIAINLSKSLTIVVSLILSIILIPLFGISGAILSSIAFVFIEDIMYLIFVLNHKSKKSN